MSALLKLIDTWKNGRDNKDCDFRDLFKEHLHKDPYFLRYSLDKSRPDLFMIYITDYSDREDHIVQECNGIIIDSNDYSIVAYGMNRMIDATDAYHNGTFKLDNNNFFEEAEDGAVLTVFNYDDTWVVSTKRSIDANNVKWSSHKNFYQLLCDALPGGNACALFDKDLDKGYTYSFILLHPENHLVIPHDMAELLYVSRRDMRSLQEINISSISDDDENLKTFTWARKRTRLTNAEALERLTLNNGRKRGIISSFRTGSNISRTMIDYKWFSEANHLRKGQPSLHLSYLACSPDEKQKMRQYFGNQVIFATIDDLLRNLIRYTFTVYKDSYVRKQFKVPDNHPIYKTIRKLHYDYKTTGQPVRIHHVVNIIETIPTHILDSMLLYFSTYGFYPPAPVDTHTRKQQTQENNVENNATIEQDKTIEPDVVQKSDVEI